LYFTEQWQDVGLFNIEQLDPDPFLALMPKLGLDWYCQEMAYQYINIESL
jgi:carboxynorspermidine synthase